MEKGDFIRINYVGRLESGELFDLTDEALAKKEKIYNPKIKYAPIPVIVSAGFVIPGIEKELLKMGVGEKKSFLVEPEEGFGQRDPKLVRVVPRKVFREAKYEPKAGQVVDFSGMKGRIQSVSAGRIMVDFNNPLAGKKLSYELEITEKIENQEDKIKAVFEFFGVDKVDIKTDGENLDLETMRLPPEIKDKLSSIILQYAKPEGVEKVRFIEAYQSKPKKEEKEEVPQE